jgi:hypothetical protein
VPLGSEFHVNTTDFGGNYQGKPAVAMDSDGDLVVVWNSFGQDGSDWGVFAQRYDKSGVPQGGEFQVNTYTPGSQGSFNYGPGVAMDAGGDFVVVWEDNNQDGSFQGIYAQRFNATGLAQGTEFRVNTSTAGEQLQPEVAMDADGNFVVCWASRPVNGNWAVFAQRYDAAGVAQGSEIFVGPGGYPGDAGRGHDVAMDADGDFVIAWNDITATFFEVYAQRFNSTGVTQGAKIHVNTHTPNRQEAPAVAMDADGDFVVTWRSEVQDGGPGFFYGVYGQRFNAAGAPQGTEFLVNTYTDGDQQKQRVAMDVAGNFVVVWQSGNAGAAGQDGSGIGVYAQQYNADGSADGPEFRVNTFTSLQQEFPAVAMDADGKFLVTWSGSGPGFSSSEVWAQRFGAPIVENQPPLADAGDDQLTVEGQAVAFDAGASSDPDGTIESYSWDFGDGSNYTETASDAPDGAFDGQTTHLYSDNGTFAATLTVTDDDGASDSDTTAIAVANVAPSVNAGEDHSISLGDSLTIVATFDDPGRVLSESYSATIDWGDGDVTAGVVDVDAGTVTANHDYQTAGNFTVVVTATDDGDPAPSKSADSMSGSDSIEVTVTQLVQSVQIDVSHDSINLASNGVIAVTLFATADFDASSVDVGTVLFAGAYAVHSALEDVDHDGDLDMVLHFRTQDTVLDEIYAQLLVDDIDADGVLDSNHQEFDVSLSGSTLDDQLFAGSDEMDLFLAGKSLRNLLDELAAAGLV